MSVLPEKYMAICSTAFGVAGIMQNLIRAAILLSFGADSTNRLGTDIYYFIASAILGVAAALYFVDKNNAYAKHHIALNENVLEEEGEYG